MARLRTLVIGGAGVALMAASLGMPAHAADTKGTLAIVNGVPGKRVDVCLDGREIKTDLRYGGVVLRDRTGLGIRIVRFFEHDPRTCRGRLIDRETFNLDPGEDLTIVVTKNEPRVVIFENQLLGQIPPTGDPHSLDFLAWRHAAEMPVTFRSLVWTPGPENPIGFAADPISTKGQELINSASPSYFVRLRATLPDDPDTIAVKRVELAVSRRYEWILVGSHPGNAKFVLLDRVVSQYSP